MPIPMADAPGPVLLFDADCGLCVGAVNWLVRRDRARRLWFAPLQGQAGQAFLRQHGLPTEDFDSLVFVPDWSVTGDPAWYERTDGLGRALLAVGGIAAGLGRLMQVVPRGWRDQTYAAVARRRRKVPAQARLTFEPGRFLP